MKKPDLILCRAPMRISFLGGGSDLPFFTASGNTGCTISATIDRYSHVLAKRRRDGRVIVHYRHIEDVAAISALSNLYVRAALEHVNWEGGIEITSMADIEVRSGLGGSGAFLVALLTALSRLSGEDASIPADIAQRAFTLEAEIIGRRTGKQDHYAAAYGGGNRFDFLPSGEVLQTPVSYPYQDEMHNCFLLLYTGVEHAADEVIADIEKRESNVHLYGIMADLARKGAAYLKRGDADKAFGLIWDSWLIKRGSSNLISTSLIDRMYDDVIAAGARAGKVCGAGGGGCMLFWCPKGKAEVLEQLNGKYQNVEFKFVDHGVQTLLEI